MSCTYRRLRKSPQQVICDYNSQGEDLSLNKSMYNNANFTFHKLLPKYYNMVSKILNIFSIDNSSNKVLIKSLSVEINLTFL